MIWSMFCILLLFVTFGGGNSYEITSDPDYIKRDAANHLFRGRRSFLENIEYDQDDLEDNEDLEKRTNEESEKRLGYLRFIRNPDHLFRGRRDQDHLFRGRRELDHLFRGRRSQNHLFRGRRDQDHLFRGKKWYLETDPEM